MKTKNNRGIARKILYYIGEVIVVIIGIFIAFQLNNLKETNKNAEDEQKSLKRIASDLYVEEIMLKSYRNQLEKSAKYLKNVVFKNSSKNLDSIVFHLSNTFVHFKMNSEYINLKYSGRLNQISNDTLRYKIVSYYEVVYTILYEMSENHKKFSSKYVENYLLTKFPSDTTFLVDPILVKKQLKDQVFKNIIIDQIAIYQHINKNLRIEELEELSKFVKREIQ